MYIYIQSTEILLNKYYTSDFEKIKWCSSQKVKLNEWLGLFFMVVSCSHLYANTAICLLMMMVLKCKDK